MAEERAGGSASGNGDGRYVYPEALTRESWGPFGLLPVDDTDPTDGRNRLEFEWGDPHVNLIGHNVDEVERCEGALRCQVMYRHDSHTQTLMPLDHAAVIAVAPAHDPLETEAGAGSIRVFLLQPQDAIVLHRGTWHWGPFPVGAPSVRLLNVQGLGYAQDNACADLVARRLDFDVPVPG